MSKLLKRAAWTGFAACLLVVGLAWIVGGELSAPTPRVIGPAPADLGAKSASFVSASGSQIHGWFAMGSPGVGALLLLHGVRGDRRDMLGRARFLHAKGYSLLLIDLQAHGESVGKRITFGDQESKDVTAALQYLHNEVPAERLGVIGESLGAASFVLARDRPQVAAVVLESMYPTIEQAITDRLRAHLGRLGPTLTPLLLWQLPMRLGVTSDRLRPIDHVADIGAPVLFLAGTADVHTTLSEAEAIYAAARSPKDFWAVDGAAHVDLHNFTSAQYERRVGGFLAAPLSATVAPSAQDPPPRGRTGSALDPDPAPEAAARAGAAHPPGRGEVESVR